MLITVHQHLNLFEALSVDTFFEVGLVSVEPTHTGRGKKMLRNADAVSAQNINRR
jgi:hypothetical protein